MFVVYFVLVIVLVIVARTMMFTPKAEIEIDESKIEFDKQAAVDALSKLVKCRTVSYYDKSLENDEEFEKLISLLPELYPHVMENCSLEKLPDRALLFHWQGREEGEPAVLMAHYDVVPV
ncbi:MAG: peptidase M20, partial [Oscillospiraceae bacterium]|nr:peptidase M20 [Oscillospiraceae bacterium]